MAIATRAQLIAGIKAGQRPTIGRTASGGNPGPAVWTSSFDIVSNNPAGVLGGTSTTQGVVPTSATPGCPPLDSFNGATGYLAQVEIATEGVPGCKIKPYDLLFKSGAHNFNAADTLASQPSYAARLPGTDYTQTEIWIETVSTWVGVASIVITYTNDAGVTGRTAVATAPANLVPRVATRVPLQAGDLGVQKIESVTSTVATAGTFNVLVLRALTGGFKNCGDTHGAPTSNFGPDLTGLPIVYDTSALYYLISMDASGTITAHEVKFVIAVG